MVTEAITKGISSLSNLIVNEKTVKWCSVTISDIFDKGKRLEASVFDIEGKNARTIIERGKYPVVFISGNQGMSSAYVCGRFKRIWVKESNYPIYQPSSIVDINPTPDDSTYYRWSIGEQIVTMEISLTASKYITLGYPKSSFVFFTICSINAFALSMSNSFNVL